MSQRFLTVREQFAQARPSCYYGEHDGWYIVAAVHRDSDALDRSNLQVLLADLGGESESVIIERAGHWAVGWIDYLIVNPHAKDKLRIAIAASKRLEDYPVLDDEHFSALEYEEFMELAEAELKEYGEDWYTVFQAVVDTHGYESDESSQWYLIEEARQQLEARCPT